MVVCNLFKKENVDITRKFEGTGIFYLKKCLEI